MPEAGRFPVGPTWPAEIQNSIELGRRAFIGAEAKQFQIVRNEDDDITVLAGNLESITPYPDSAGDAVWAYSVTSVTALTPFSPVNSTNYGVWIEVNLSTASAGPTQGSGIGDLALDTFSTATIITDTTYYQGTAGDKTALCVASAGKSYIYLGKVAVDGSGNTTITQSLYGPILLPAITYLINQVSSVANNAFRVDASDNRFAVTPVSTDANNSISIGTDKGAFLQVAAAGSGINVSVAGGVASVSNTGVVQVIGGTDISVAPAGGTGTVTINDDTP